MLFYPPLSDRYAGKVLFYHIFETLVLTVAKSKSSSIFNSICNTEQAPCLAS